MEIKDGKEEITKQSDNDRALEDSLKRGLDQLEKGMGRPHEEVWPEIRKRYADNGHQSKPNSSNNIH